MLNFSWVEPRHKPPKNGLWFPIEVKLTKLKLSWSHIYINTTFETIMKLSNLFSKQTISTIYYLYVAITLVQYCKEYLYRFTSNLQISTKTTQKLYENYMKSQKLHSFVNMYMTKSISTKYTKITHKYIKYTSKCTQNTQKHTQKYAQLTHKLHQKYTNYTKLHNYTQSTHTIYKNYTKLHTKYIKLRKNYTQYSHKNYTQITQKLHKNHTQTTQKLHKNYTHKNCTQNLLTKSQIY